MEERVTIFIDGSNLYHAMKDSFRRFDLNFTEFSKKLCGTRPLVRTYYYNILQEPSQWPEAYKEQQEFLEILNKSPYLEIRLGSTKLQQGSPVEKGIDIMLAVDMLNFAHNDIYDTGILVSGDGDFAYALKAIKNLGKHIEVAYFENNISKDLLDIADYRQFLNREFFSGLWYGRGYVKRRQRRPA